MEQNYKYTTLKYQSFGHALKTFAFERPVISIRDKMGLSLIVTDFIEIDYALFEKEQMFTKESLFCESSMMPFERGGVIGLIPYETYAKNYCFDLLETEKPRCFKILSSLVFDESKKTLCFFEDCESQFGSSLPRLDAIVDVLYANFEDKASCDLKVDLDSLMKKKEHISKIDSIKEDIKNGQYYQLNFLNYFDVNFSTSQGAPKKEYLIEKYLNFSGPFSCLFLTETIELVSLSPERFFRVEKKSNDHLIQAQPIKGTIKKSLNLKKDQVNKMALLNSEKDHAELNMIIDLLRNDLYACAKSGSVTVKQDRELQTFSHLHHLVATLEAYLDGNLAWEDVFCAMFPAGSITGAPKKAVIEKIKQLEIEPRGYFMGSCFYTDPARQVFDSSVLIRTMYKRKNQKYMYASGSGITLKSDSKQEVEECFLKAKAFRSSD